MSEWWTYTIADFLMYSARTYYRLIERFNTTFWPLQLLGLALGIAILVTAVRRSAWGRAVLFEELACCVLSYSFVAAAVRDAWFLEQVEIQPVFYGMEDDVPGFWRVVADAYAAHRDEADAIVDAAFDRLACLLQWSGAPATLCAPARLSLPDMLAATPASA